MQTHRLPAKTYFVMLKKKITVVKNTHRDRSKEREKEIGRQFTISLYESKQPVVYSSSQIEQPIAGA